MGGASERTRKASDLMTKQLSLFPASEPLCEGGRQPAPSRVFQVVTRAVYDESGECMSYQGTIEEVTDEDLRFQQTVEDTDGVYPYEDGE